MTASILKQNPNSWKVKKDAIYLDKKTTGNFLGVIPLFQATKQHLNNC